MAKMVKLVIFLNLEGINFLEKLSAFKNIP
jgi:hypothetical protein